MNKMMTIFITIITFLTFSIGFSQIGELNGRIIEHDEIGFPGLAVELIKDGKSFYQTQTDFNGNYNFKNISFGTYLIKISYVGMKEETFENIIINTQNTSLDFTYPKPCLSNKKNCPKGHTNKIIPIVYGLPTKKTIKKAENKKVKLGGCTPYCEKWHCTEHNLDF